MTTPTQPGTLTSMLTKLQAKRAAAAPTTTLPTLPPTTKAPEAGDKKEEAKPVVPTGPRQPIKRANPVPVHKKQSIPTDLTIDPRTLAKIIYMRDRGSSEVSGFGISHPDDPFYVIDFKLVPQINTGTFTEFLDKALANYLEDMVVSGVKPARCLRIWIHTHPGMGPSPSSHDEATFKRVNEDSSWGVMCVVADTTEYARLLVHNEEGMDGSKELKVVVALDEVFEGVTDEDYKAWEDEYCENVAFGDAPSVVEEYQHCGHYGITWQEQAWRDDDLVGPSKHAINGEIVHQMKQESDTYFYVYTDKFWFQFGHREEVICDVGQTLLKVTDISGYDAHDWGDVIWNGDEPIMYYQSGEDHDLNFRFDEIEEAEAVEDEDEEEQHGEKSTDPEPGPPAEGYCGPREAS